MNVFWFRRDLRLDDNAGLYHALKNSNGVLCLFIFDSEILSILDNKADARVEFIHERILFLDKLLKEYGSSLLVKFGKPIDVFSQMANEFPVKSVYTNHDYEPYALQRDKEVLELLKSKGIDFNTNKDQVIFEKDEILSNAGTPYTVFTPYGRKWSEKLDEFYLKTYPVEKYMGNLFKSPSFHIPSLKELGFRKSGLSFPSNEVSDSIITNYENTRNEVTMDATSHLGIHLRFGTVSIRKLAARAGKLSSSYLNELKWREFFQMILWNFPHVVENSFRREYDRIEWRNNEVEFEAWCQGKTGYPMVDAGMRELNATGFMHNRSRMITAGFLCKHLLIDWRWGERYFAEKLLDFELAANNGNWQWAAGTGCDAAPYFRIFSPDAQQKKFDPKAIYIRKWVPEYGTPLYPQPIVQHELARARALEAYKRALT